MLLNEKEIKILKDEKKIAYAFTVAILGATGLFNLFIQDYVISLTNLLAINTATIGFSFLVPYLMNKKVNKDLQDGRKYTKIETVQKKRLVISQEAGVGNLWYGRRALNRLFGGFIANTKRFNLFINGMEYEVDKETYDHISDSDTVKMHYAQNSHLLLKITKV